jgi:hypothetical protein
MALLNKKEFAAICRTTTAVIDTNISRGNIIYLKEDKLVDSDDPVNRGFFLRYERLHNDKQSKEKLVKKIEADYEEVVEKVTEKVTKKEAATRVTESKKKSKVTNDWYERKLQADTLLQEARAEKENLNLEKAAGKLIPVDLVFDILNIHNHDIFATFQNDAENLASVYCDILAGGDRKKLSEITTKLSEKLDDVVRRAKEVSMSSLEMAIGDYQEVRSRGEKK